MKKILVLFPNEWDHFELARRAHQYEFLFEGFDLFKFPDAARLLTFTASRFIERMVSKYRHARLSGVFSSDEHFGAMIAAVVAQRLGLPGADPAAILTCQHKFYARLRQREIAPEATPHFSIFPYEINRPRELELDFPLFVKPVKATFSILARRVASFEELQQHLHFGLTEKIVLKRLIKPFNDLARTFTEFDFDAHHFVAEEILSGIQVTAECFVNHGEVEVIGVTDAVMFPGTDAFQRFVYPSALPEAVQQRMLELTQRLVRGFEYKHGLFNVEFVYEPESGKISIIEVNPRMAYQFADFYEKVDGCNSYDVQLALCAGDRPDWRRRQGKFNTAASFVLRSFEGSPLKASPAAAEIQRVRREHPDLRLMLYLRKGASLRREMKWLGSYRYALINLGGMNHDDLHERYQRVLDQLTFDLA